jgi:conjugative transfer signal peptidase TraF
MNGRERVLVAMFAAVGILALNAGKGALPLLLWNASASVPVGLYRLQSIDKLYAADLVVVVPPEPLASFLIEGNYLSRGVPMLKRVLALPGQTVCRQGLTILIDSISMGMARERDGRGRLLPAWQGCRAIAADQIFLMNWQSADSLDGRYFGPIPASAAVARAHPIWTEKED